MNELSLTIDFAVECRKKYLELLTGEDDVIFDVSEITDIDLAGLQILLALFKQAAIEKKKLRLTGIVGDNLQSCAVTAGISDTPCRTGEELEQAIISIF